MSLYSIRKFKKIESGKRIVASRGIRFQVGLIEKIT